MTSAAAVPPPVVLLSTTIADAKRAPIIDRMLEGIDRAAQSLPGLKLYFLVQGDPDGWTTRQLGPHVEVLHVPEKVSLSKARNVLLRRAQTDNAIATTGIVAFPDDDSWYPVNVLESIVATFQHDEDLDFWFCQYSSGAPDMAAVNRFEFNPPSVGDLARNASSNTMFMRGHIVLSCGDFDESLGVGTALGGGEDLDYALRAFRSSERVGYLAQPVVGHRDKGASRSNYFRSSLYVLSRHARINPDVRSERRRKIAVGAALVARRELAPLEFLRSLRTLSGRP